MLQGRNFRQHQHFLEHEDRNRIGKNNCSTTRQLTVLEVIPLLLAAGCAQIPDTFHRRAVVHFEDRISRANHGRSNSLKSFLSAITVVLTVFGFCCNARAQTEVTLLSPMPIQESMEKLVAGFESKTGIHVKVTYGSGLG